MLKKLQKPKSEGFTIIEVMIVLAIAGLILLIVFLAVPALQRGSRNTQRKSEASSVLSSIATYVSNNNGTAPSTQALLDTARSDAKLNFYTGANIFYGDNTKIPTSAVSGGVTGTALILTTENIIFFSGTVCNGNQATITGASARSYTIMYAVETGGAATPQCLGS